MSERALEEAWVSSPPGRGGGVKIAVAYPNTYWVGMSNLGYQALLRTFLETPGFDVRRVFMEKQGLWFPDGGRSLSDFHTVVFSVSFHPDLIHLHRMLETGGTGKSRAASGKPLLIGGGVALTLNPEIGSNDLDLIVVGDSEPALPGIMDALLSWGGRGSVEDLLDKLSEQPSCYIPSKYGVEPDGVGIYRIPSPKGGAPPEVAKAVLADLDDRPARPAVVTRDTEFGSLYLLEVSRGCGAGCAFCAASVACGPVRFLGLTRFEEELATGLRFRKKIGFVGTAVSYHPELLRMADMVIREGGGFSPSSVRLEFLKPPLAELLSASGHRTVAVAPEAGTERLRASVGKGFSDEAVMGAIDVLQDAGIPNIKLYFMVGLPGETEGDVDAIVEMVKSVRKRVVAAGRKRGKAGSVSVSVNAMIPKPQTPLERTPMASEDVLNRRFKRIRRGLGGVGGVRVQTGSIRMAYLDALLSLGDRDVAGALGELPARGLSLKGLIRSVPEAERILFGREGAGLPWEMFKG